MHIKARHERKLRRTVRRLKKMRRRCKRKGNPFPAHAKRTLEALQHELLYGQAQTMTRGRKKKQNHARPAANVSISGQDIEYNKIMEAMLLLVPPRDLLVNAMRVSKRWLTIIEKSERLQQALFLRPLPGPLVLYIDNGKNGFWSANKYNGFASLVFNNPFLDLICERQKSKIGSEEWSILQRVGASWKRMLICQPSIKEAHHPQAIWDYVSQYFEIEYRSHPTEYFRLHNLFNAVLWPTGQRRPTYVYPKGWMKWTEVTTGKDVRHVKLPLPIQDHTWQTIVKSE